MRKDICCVLLAAQFPVGGEGVRSPKVGCGRPIGDDGVFLDGHTELPGTASDTGLSVQFRKRQKLLATHLKVFRNLDKTDQLDLW